ncbi:MAG: tryptophan-rich sensory protein [Candidatus Pacebacteria bacterium]|nr:tryptophan-rich sensory protein [Candidatus Paceibacterota bacterium]
MEGYLQYAAWLKPSWAPPAWLFGPVWSVLYALIAVSFGYVFYRYFMGTIPAVVALPFALNLIFNIAFTPIQFGLGSLWLSSVDILLVFATLAWALYVIYPYAPWVTYINLPYLLWVAFATVLQLTIFALNSF